MTDNRPAGSVGLAEKASIAESWRLAHEIPVSWDKLGYAWHLFLHLVSLQLRLRFKGSWLGMVYTLANPIVQLVVFSLIFTRVMRVDVASYPLFLCCGLLCWNAFRESLAMAVMSVASAPSVLYQPGFPPSALPLVVVAMGLVQFIMSLSILAVMLLYYQAPLGWSVTALPIIICVQTLLILALAYPLAAMQVSFHDVRHLLTVVLRFMFFLTPILYSADSFPPVFRIFYEINPLTQLIDAYRAVFMHGDWPDWAALAGVAVGSVILLILGFRYFESRRFQFIENL